MKKISLIVIAILILGISGSLAYAYYVHQKLNSIVMIDVIKVVNGFEMKKELEKNAESKLMPLKNKVDSISAIVDYALKHNTQVDNKMKEELAYWQQNAMQAYEYSNNTINEQVWKRLNPLIDLYGKQKNYKVIIGANGMGTVLYAEKGMDKTDELIEFVNQQYQKGEK